MMNFKILTAILIHLLFVNPYISAQHTWEELSKRGELLAGSHLALPKYISFSDSYQVSPDSVLNMLDRQFRLSERGYGFLHLEDMKDPQGETHKRYIQTFQRIPVEGSMYILHENAQGVYATSGHFYHIDQADTQPIIPSTRALQQVLRTINARTYNWELHKSSRSRDSSHIVQHAPPSGELVYVPKDGKYRSPLFQLAWKFDVYAQYPMSKTRNYVDATSGNVFLQINLLHTTDTTGQGFTRFSGQQTIVTQWSEANNQFVLRETQRGGGVFTWDMNESTNFDDAKEIYDQDNTWNHTDDSIAYSAIDAHWGAEMTYDFFLERFGRNSFDDNGSPINCYVHFGEDFNNAFWDGRRAVFGDGNGKALSTLDIVAHELAHGVTQYSSRLIYQGESGALNESFSDIMGKGVEYYNKPESFTWKIGNDRGLIIRSMENPNLTGHPQNYQGARWYNGEEDNGGVHINSGVQNYWFFLLTQGGKGINDFGESFEVSAIGMDTALAIVYRTYTVYMTPSSTYEDAKYFSTIAAIDLYGACSSEHRAVTNAWHAVGLDRPFSEVPIADFTVSSTELCTEPYEVQFHQKASNSSSYIWDFGDGTMDSTANPTHTYRSVGTYPVTLVVDGFCGSKDTLMRRSYITINSSPEKPIATQAFISCRESTYLTAEAHGEAHWYDQWGQQIHIGDTLFTPVLNNDITYSVKNFEFDPPVQIGPIQDSIQGEGGYHDSNFEARIYFQVMQNLRLNSVAVDAETAGKRTLILEDGSGQLLQQIEIYIPEGKSRIDLNLDLSPGTYRLGGRNLQLYRHSSGATFPYSIENVISLTGSPPDAGPSFYYYFYDWTVSTYCVSAPTSTNIFVSQIDVPEVPDTSICGQGSIALNANKSNVNWYDIFGDLLFSGQTFETPVLDSTAIYFVESFLEGTHHKLGPRQETLSSQGGFHNNEFNARLQFEVYTALRLKSVFVNAGSSGTRRIVLEDREGNMLDAFNVYIPEGPSRIQLDLDLQPGAYAIGGRFMDLYRNTAGATYPYTVDSLISITGSNAFTSDEFYYYFYDWEVTETPCYSNAIPVQVEVKDQLQAAFSYRQQYDTLSFTALNPEATYWRWNFGDGSIDTVQHPIYAYGDTGKYVVTLTTGTANCRGTISLPVVISELGDPGIISNHQKDLNNSISIFPNPARDRITIHLQTQSVSPLHLQVSDLTGKIMHKAQFQQETTLNIQEYPKGAYLLQIQPTQNEGYRQLIIVN